MAKLNLAKLKTKEGVGIIIIIIIALIVGFALQQPKEKVIKIGVIATLTGPGSYQGQQELRGLELAKQELNSICGISGKKIEFITEDSKADPATAVNVANKLINLDKVSLLIGDSWSSTTAAIIPIVNEFGVILISPLATLDDLSKDDLFFRTMPITKDMMTPLAEHAYFKMGSREVGILRQQTPFGVEHARDFKAAFEKLGGEITGEESFDIKEADVRSQIIKIKNNNPDTILNLHATGPMMGLLIKQAKELGVEVKWLGSWGSENANLMKEYGNIIEDLTYPYPYNVQSEDIGVQKFIKDYQQKYNELPELTAANSHDALKLICEAISEVGAEPLKIKNFLLKVQDYQGASGSLTFDANGDIKKTIIIKTIKNGQFRPYKESE